MKRGIDNLTIIFGNFSTLLSIKYKTARQGQQENRIFE